MKLPVYNLNGEKEKELTLPKQFDEPIRVDIIKRAVLSLQSSTRTPYGAYKEAGKRYSSTLSRRRRRYKGSYGRGISRSPRKVLTKRGTQFYFVGATAPFTVGGRRAHPPKSEKIWVMKINKKERREAIRSALAATADLNLVSARGHRTNSSPIILVSKAETITKTKEVKNLLMNLGLDKELSRIKTRKVRSGKGKSRGRKYKTKIGPLLVISKECSLGKAARNIQGIDVCQMRNLNVELLAPGAMPGRLTIFTESAINELSDKKLFTNEALGGEK